MSDTTATAEIPEDVATPEGATPEGATLAILATAAPDAEEQKVDDAVEEVTQSLEDILALGQGLDDEDYKAELEVLQNDPNSNLYSAVTFEELDLCVSLSMCCCSGSGATIA